MNTSTHNTNPNCGCTACTCQPCNCFSPAEALPLACACSEECGCDGGDQGCLCQ